jgi:hypothetical protein
MSQSPTIFISIILKFTAWVGISYSILAICSLWLIPSLTPSPPTYTRRATPKRHSLSPPRQRQQRRPKSTSTLPLPPVVPLVTPPPRPTYTRKSSVAFTVPWPMTTRSRTTGPSSEHSGLPSPKSRPHKSFIRRLSSPCPTIKRSISASTTSATAHSYANYLRTLPRFNCELKDRPQKPPAPTSQPKKPLLLRRNASDHFSFSHVLQI